MFLLIELFVTLLLFVMLLFVVLLASFGKRLKKTKLVDEEYRIQKKEAEKKRETKKSQVFKKQVFLITSVFLGTFFLLSSVIGAVAAPKVCAKEINFDVFVAGSVGLVLGCLSSFWPFWWSI